MQNDENARLQEQINREFEQFGKLLPDTERQLQDLEQGVKNSTLANQQAVSALGGLKDAVGSTISSVYQGKQGAAAFAGAADGIAKAASSAGNSMITMGGPINIIIGLTLKLIGKITELAKVVSEQAEAEFKGYQKMSKVGAATSKGMSDVFDTSQKLGIGVYALDDYIGKLAARARDLAVVGGTVAGGRKMFEDMIGEMAPFRAGLQNANISQEDQNEGGLEYIALMSRYQRVRGKTSKELADSYREYLIEEDRLTKATGVTRREREADQMDALADERWAATLQTMRDNGQIDEAKRLENLNKMLSSSNAGAAKGMRHAATGFYTSAESLKFTRSTLGEGAQIIDQVKKGTLSDIEGTAQINAKIADTSERFGSLHKIGGGDQIFFDAVTRNQATLVTAQNLTRAMQLSGKEGENQGIKTGKALDKLQQDATDRVLAAQKTTLNAQKLAQGAVSTVAGYMKNVAQAADKSTAILDKTFGGKKTQAPAAPAVVPGGTGTPSRGGRQPPPAPPPPAPPPPPPPPPPPATPSSPQSTPPSTPPPPPPKPTPESKPGGEVSSPSEPSGGVPGGTGTPSRLGRIKKPKGSTVDPNDLAARLKEHGFSPAAIGNILAQVQGESGFRPRSEEIAKYSAATMFKLWGPPGVDGGQSAGGKNTVKFKTLADAQQAHDGDPVALGDLLYGFRGGNDKPGDGFKYRGRGLVGLTFKNNYKKYGEYLEKIGYPRQDLVANPDLVNDPEIGQQLVVAYFKERASQRKFDINGKDLGARFNLEDATSAGDAVGFAGGDDETKKRALYAKEFAKDLEYAARGGVFQARGASRNSNKSPFEILLKGGAVPVNIVGNMMNEMPTPDSSSTSVKLGTKVTRTIAGQLREVARDIVVQIQAETNTELDAAILDRLSRLSRAKQTANSINQRLLRIRMN